MTLLSLVDGLTLGNSDEAERFPASELAPQILSPLRCARDVHMHKHPCRFRDPCCLHCLNTSSFHAQHALQPSRAVMTSDGPSSSDVNDILTSGKGPRHYSVASRRWTYARKMSSDGHVSDHGHQVVESIEESDDVKMGGLESSEDEGLKISRELVAPAGRGKGHREEDWGDTAASGQSSDSGNSSNDAAEGNPSNDAAGSGDELFYNQPPPSHQVPAQGSDYTPSDADSNASTTSELRHEPLSEGVSSAEYKRPRKRKTAAEDPDLGFLHATKDFRPIKKAKGAVNREYLDLLNEDIEHAASRYVPAGHNDFDQRKALPTSQVGMIVWTTSEKERFFEALGRLGRDDTAGISERVGTKGELEVRQYLKLLRDGLARRRYQHELDPLGPADFPAATELSQECCQALEDAADVIALRQEHSENAAEERRHGSDWLVSQETHKDLAEGKPEEAAKDAASIFRVPEWLSLSERFFMNAPGKEGNWQAVEGDTPSIRLTTLENFRSLALTLTRRLVASSLYMATTRIRAERGYRSETRDYVKEKDIRAAAMSLGLATRKPPLMGCVRRLGLSVYEEAPKPHEHAEMEAMSHSAVEAELDIERPPDSDQIRRQLKLMALSSDDSSVSSDSLKYGGMESEVKGGGSGSELGIDSGEEEEVRAEANEAILYSAVDPPQTKRDREALFRRIKAERAQERYAEMVDARASYLEEVRMWNVLGKPRPTVLVDPGSPPSGRRLRLTVDAASVSASASASARDWRAKTKVVGEWEARYERTT